MGIPLQFGNRLYTLHLSFRQLEQFYCCGSKWVCERELYILSIQSAIISEIFLILFPYFVLVQRIWPWPVNTWKWYWATFTVVHISGRYWTWKRVAMHAPSSDVLPPAMCMRKKSLKTTSAIAWTMPRSNSSIIPMIPARCCPIQQASRPARSDRGSYIAPWYGGYHIVQSLWEGTEISGSLQDFGYESRGWSLCYRWWHRWWLWYYYWWSIMSLGSCRQVNCLLRNWRGREPSVIDSVLGLYGGDHGWFGSNSYICLVRIFTMRGLHGRVAADRRGTGVCPLCYKFRMPTEHWWIMAAMNLGFLMLLMNHGSKIDKPVGHSLW